MVIRCCYSSLHKLALTASRKVIQPVRYRVFGYNSTTFLRLTFERPSTAVSPLISTCFFSFFPLCCLLQLLSVFSWLVSVTLYPLLRPSILLASLRNGNTLGFFSEKASAG
jgi:hypothetical protein